MRSVHEQHDIHATQAGLLQAESAPFRRCQTGSNRNKASWVLVYAGWPLMSNTLKRTSELVIASYPAQQIFTQRHSFRRLVQSSTLHGALPPRERVRLRRGKLSSQNGARQFNALKRHPDVNCRREHEGAQSTGGGPGGCNARRQLRKVLVPNGPLPPIDSLFSAFVDTM